MVQKYITLNAFREEPTIIHAVQGESESRTLYIALADSAGNPVDLTGKAVRFYAEKPDKTVVFDDCAIEDAAAGKVSIVLSYQAVAMKGTVNCTIYVNTSENEALKFTNLKIAVESSSVEMYVESSNEFSALVAALSQVQDIDSRVLKSAQIAGIAINDGITLAQLLSAGLASGTGGAANNALALGGVDAQSIIDPGHTAESNGYTKLQNGIIIEWLKYNTPVVTANTIYSADITPTHIQNVLCAIGSVIPGTAWDFGPSAVFNLDTSKANLVIKCGTTAQSFSATIVAVGT